MSKGKPKTEGYIWLEHSFTAFNGSGYGDRDTPTAFVESYIQYKQWKKDTSAVKLAISFYTPLLTLAEYLIENSDGAGREVSPKNFEKFNKFKDVKHERDLCHRTTMAR
jgi:hypothetical protein